jgi:hypothetical protein
MHWEPPELWPDGECWILGGGASMPRQFGISDDVINNVESSKDPISVYTEHFSPLHDKHVIGTNIAFMLGDWISVLYFCDTVFFRVYRKEIMKFPNLKVTCVNHLGTKELPYSRNIKRMKRDNRPGLSNASDTICWNYNSGAAAIDFAAHLGVRRILLLGFDMKPENNRTHWHEGFQNYGKQTGEKSFERFLRTFPKIAQDAKKRGIEILNVNPDSAIEDFTKVSLKEVL